MISWIKLKITTTFLHNMKKKLAESFHKKGTVDFIRVRNGFEKMTRKYNLKQKGYIYTDVQIGNLKGEWITPEGLETESILLYFHGGAYHFGSILTSRSLASQLSTASKCKTLLVEYRKSPEYNYPVPIDDAVQTYLYLINEKRISPSRICFGGDSAGGGIAIGTMMWLRDNKMPLPSCAIVLSPWLDHTATSESFQKNDDLDPMLIASAFKDYSRSYLGHAALDAKYASPIFHDVSGLPPICVQVGEYELLLDDSKTFAAKATQAGVQVSLEVFPRHFHVFQCFHHILPSAKVAIKKLGDFIQLHISK